MLHCLKFADTIVGGESTFVDTFIIADVLRKRYPEAFEALCTIPATFQKSHVEREHPAQMFYQRPHISTNHQGEVNAVFWSPPFEGPLKVHANDVDKYYDAYDKFKYLNKMFCKWAMMGKYICESQRPHPFNQLMTTSESPVICKAGQL